MTNTRSNLIQAQARLHEAEPSRSVRQVSPLSFDDSEARFHGTIPLTIPRHDGPLQALQLFGGRDAFADRAGNCNYAARVHECGVALCRQTRATARATREFNRIYLHSSEPVLHARSTAPSDSTRTHIVDVPPHAPPGPPRLAPSLPRPRLPAPRLPARATHRPSRRMSYPHA